MAANPNPRLFESREASEPYSRGQWDSALKATPHSPKGDIWYVGALEPTACSTAHGFRSRHPRSLLTTLNHCRIRANKVLAGSLPAVVYLGVRKKNVCPVTNLVASLSRYLTRPTISSF